MRMLYPWHEWLAVGSRKIYRSQFGSLKTDSIRRQFYTRAAEYGRKVSVSICDRLIVVCVREDSWTAENTGNT